ncbi:MAG: transcription antitermination factor NusB [Micrococcaceae bacterium]
MRQSNKEFYRNKPRNPRVSFSRLAAYEVLAQVSEDGAYANLALQQILKRRHLSHQDAAFATELANGALRNQLFYRAILQKAIDRPLAKVDQKLLNVLYLALHQLLSMRVADHAAVDQSVNLAKKVAGESTAGFVNAILRKVQVHSKDEWLDVVLENTTDPLERMSIEFSHPVWIIRALKQSLAVNGRSIEELPQVLEANNIAPLVNLVALDGLVRTQQMVRAGATESSVVKNAAEWKQGSLRQVPGITEGKVRVQDAGSQLVARALTSVLLEGSDTQWLDLCAGPGGKAALLTAIAQQRDAKLIANEVQKHRAELVKQALKPLSRGHYEVRIDDGRKYGTNRENYYDRVMVDAPCTGLGSLRRRPEARWRKQMDDVAELVPLQKELLNSAYKATRVGGVIAYVTCSPHISETQRVIEWFFQQHPEAELLDTNAIMQSVAKEQVQENPPSNFKQQFLPENTKGSIAQLWPDIHRTDAMFCALIKKGTA